MAILFWDNLLGCCAVGFIIPFTVQCQHWIDAKYIGDGYWDFSNFQHYSLNSLPSDCVTYLFQEGVQFLNKIAREINPGYHVCAFRAGGWAIQPFSHLKQGFLSSGVYIDSSVIRGAIIEKDGYKVNFSNAPDLDYYFFSDNVIIPSNDGAFIEVPISRYRLSRIHCLWNVINSHFTNKYQSLTDGSHYRNDNKKRTNLKNKLNSIFSERVFTINGMHPKVIKKAILSSPHQLIVFSSHPKDFTIMALENISILAKLCKFVTFNDIG